MKNIKYVVAISLSIAIFAGNAGIALAQTSTTTEALLNQIQSLLQQIRSLQDQINQLNTQLQQTLQLTKSLRLGMTNDEVRLLQEMLATDPDIYPEGLTTGFFGPLTEKAVKKFQAKFGIEQVGEVGPKTLTKLNALLTEGAGKSGKVPPGLLTAPGIAKKLATPTAPANKKLAQDVTKKPNVTTPDTTAPIISNLVAVSTASTTAHVFWNTNEKTFSILWYSNTTPVNTNTAPKTEGRGIVHSHNITGLTAATTYYYVVKVTDMAGNSATSTEYSFTTPEN